MPWRFIGSHVLDLTGYFTAQLSEPFWDHAKLFIRDCVIIGSHCPGQRFVVWSPGRSFYVLEHCVFPATDSGVLRNCWNFEFLLFVTFLSRTPVGVFVGRLAALGISRTLAGLTAIPTAVTTTVATITASAATIVFAVALTGVLRRTVIAAT